MSKLIKKPRQTEMIVRKKQEKFPRSLIHLGERVQHGKYGYRLTREEYAMPNKRSSLTEEHARLSERAWAADDKRFDDPEHKFYKDEWCEYQRVGALKNFDLNMNYFQQIDPADFDSALNETLASIPQLKPVPDLEMLEGTTGLYIMVLDAFRQIYVGQSSNMRKRIKAHWAGTKPFDRLLFGGVNDSVLSVDVFRPLDTTRVFAAKTVRADSLETKLVENFPREFLLNRINGGLADHGRVLMLATEQRHRQLSSDESHAE